MRKILWKVMCEIFPFVGTMVLLIGPILVGFGIAQIGVGFANRYNSMPGVVVALIIAIVVAVVCYIQGQKELVRMGRALGQAYARILTLSLLPKIVPTEEVMRLVLGLAASNIHYASKETSSQSIRQRKQQFRETLELAMLLFPLDFSSDMGVQYWVQYWGEKDSQYWRKVAAGS